MGCGGTVAILAMGAVFGLLAGNIGISLKEPGLHRLHRGLLCLQGLQRMLPFGLGTALRREHLLETGFGLGALVLMPLLGR
nr:hypothetical protein NCPCFENI_01282 [Cupriavidus sp.]